MTKAIEGKAVLVRFGTLGERVATVRKVFANGRVRIVIRPSADAPEHCATISGADILGLAA